MILIYNATQNMKNRVTKKLKQIDELKVKDQRGMTLLEIIIVLGIIGTIAAGVVILAQRAFDSRTISEIVSNTNTVRIAVKDAYQRAPAYPDPLHTATLAYDADTIRDHANPQPIVASLVQLGKLSTDEARNGISNDFYNIGGAQTSTGSTVNKGYFVEVNGLSQSQCRSIVSQVGNQWDYVEIVDTGAGAGVYTVTAPIDMDVAPTATAGATAGILRSLNVDGNVLIAPEDITGLCSDTTTNAVVLGSR